MDFDKHHRAFRKLKKNLIIHLYLQIRKNIYQKYDIYLFHFFFPFMHYFILLIVAILENKAESLNQKK